MDQRGSGVRSPPTTITFLLNLLAKRGPRTYLGKSKKRQRSILTIRGHTACFSEGGELPSPGTSMVKSCFLSGESLIGSSEVN